MTMPSNPMHLLPQVQQRPIPPALIESLQAHFQNRCSTAMAVREQHGRDESSFDVPPPGAVVFAHSTADVAAAVKLAARRPHHPLWRGQLARRPFAGSARWH